ncbi:hypothetical protein [Metabacillus malikii]|uniref:Uncharacterized protein n=1 Tax=Metabacillus malikii TaxID=1504265 RepID=A0ABT9ZQB3_9BACI|nr:hypothetical protein [Metabacillus malikii]MDQ0233420.1 hypothetical protein [Metabacillus malikii]
MQYKYLTEITGMFQSKEISIPSFSTRQLANNDTYKDVIGEIKANTRPSIKELIGVASIVPATMQQ